MKREQIDEVLADIQGTLVEALKGLPKKERERIAEYFDAKGREASRSTPSNRLNTFENIKAHIFWDIRKAITAWTPPKIPQTCVEAADQLTAASIDAYLPDAKSLREVAETLRAFGEDPLPKSIRDSYKWGQIGK